jgi:hypothetical protein
LVFGEISLGLGLATQIGIASVASRTLTVIWPEENIGSTTIVLFAAIVAGRECGWIAIALVRLALVIRILAREQSHVAAAIACDVSTLFALG